MTFINNLSGNINIGTFQQRTNNISNNIDNAYGFNYDSVLEAVKEIEKYKLMYKDSSGGKIRQFVR